MFDFFRNNTKFLQFVLLVLIVPAFVLTGVYQGYSAFTESGAAVAKVAGQEITKAEWDAAHREQVERARRQMPNLDARLFDSPEMKRQALEGIVRDRVMLVAADKLNLITTDDRLLRLFTTDPQFAFLRNPDGSVNKDLLAAQGMSSELFAQRLRQDLTLRQVLLGVEGTAFASASVTSTALDALFEQREVQVQRFDAKDYSSKVNPSDADIEAYYKDPANAAQFQAPEQAVIEYVVLDLDTMKKDAAVSLEDLRKYYDENVSRYTTPEERRASHILVKADKGESADERAKAKAKAETLLAQARQNPDKFAELARQHSQDPGSAERGGDLDFFTRDAMVKPFADAAFALKPGEVSGVVVSDFGFHIIRLTAVRGGDKRSFEAVRAELENEVRGQLAQKKFSEAAVDFTNMVYEQAESLKPVVDKFKLELRTAQGVQRAPVPGATGPLANAKFLEALFSDDAIRNKRNTDAVETGASQLVSGRVVQHAPARLLPLADVRDKVRERVVAKQAAALAHKDGQARLAELQASPQAALTAPAQTVSRVQSKDLPQPVVDAALRADAGVLPAAAGVDLGEQGYAVVRVNKVLGRDPVAADAARAQSQYAQAWGDAEAQAYYAALKSRFRVEINVPSTAVVTGGDTVSR